MSKRFTFFLLFSSFGAIPALAASEYAGSDTACFYGVASSHCTLTGAKSTLGAGTGTPPLSYTPTAAGFTAPATGGTIDLGTFSVGRSLAAGEAGTFDIDISFTDPAGAGGKEFSATTLGVVLFGVGGAEITFDKPTTELFTYPGGSFDLSLPSGTFTVGAGRSKELDATITPLAASTPEPSFLPLLGAILVLFGVVARRRASSQNA